MIQMCVSHSVMSDCDPMDCRARGILQARIQEWVAFPFSKGSFQPRDQTRSPALQADSLPSEPPGKPPMIQMNLFKIETDSQA